MKYYMSATIFTHTVKKVGLFSFEWTNTFWNRFILGIVFKSELRKLPFKSDSAQLVMKPLPKRGREISVLINLICLRKIVKVFLKNLQFYLCCQ